MEGGWEMDANDNQEMARETQRHKTSNIIGLC